MRKLDELEMQLVGLCLGHQCLNRLAFTERLGLAYQVVMLKRKVVRNRKKKHSMQEKNGQPRP